MSETGKKNGLREMLEVVFSLLPFIKQLFALCLVISIVLPFTITTKYTLTGEIVVLSKKIFQGGRGEISGGASARYLPVTLTDMETENNIIRSLPLIRKTVTDLYDDGSMYIEQGIVSLWIIKPLADHIINPLKTWFIGEGIDTRIGHIDGLTKIALDRLDVTTIPGSNITTVSYEAENAEMALSFVNRLMENYLLRRDALMRHQETDDFFLEKKNSYKERLVSLELERVELFGKYGVTNTKEELALTLGNINLENSVLNKVLDNRLESNAWLKYLKEQLENLKKSDVTKISFPYSFGGSGTSGNEFYVDTEMKEQIVKIAALQSEYATAQLSFQKNSEKVSTPFRQLEQQKVRLIILVENRILERTEGIKVLDTVIASKKARIATYQKRAELLKEVSAQEAGIITELRAVNDAYFKYSQFYEERRSQQFASLADISNVRILSAATIPLEPSSPKPIFVLLIGFVCCVLISFTLALVREILDSRFHYPGQVTAQMGLPVIAIVDDADIPPPVPFGYKLDEVWKWLKQ